MEKLASLTEPALPQAIPEAVPRLRDDWLKRELFRRTLALASAAHELKTEAHLWERRSPVRTAAFPEKRRNRGSLCKHNSVKISGIDNGLGLTKICHLCDDDLGLKALAGLFGMTALVWTVPLWKN